MNAEKSRKYYSIFINTMAAIIRDFNATIIKNTGDSLLYYFPETSNNSADDDDIPVFREIFECGITMVEASAIINTKAKDSLINIVVDGKYILALDIRLLLLLLN